MAKDVALICEFNPLHNGHQAILEYAGSLGGRVIAVMSGNFTQRSIPASFDKYKRAEAALRCGADAVFELPFPWCSGGAEFFAAGAVAIAKGLALESFVFGSESGETSHVMKAVEVLESDEYSSALEENDTSVGTAAAFDLALRKYGITLGSNDKLACEYVRAAGSLGMNADFHAYKRMTDEHSYRSATVLREMLSKGISAEAYIPEEAHGCLGYTADSDISVYEEIMFRHFRMMRNPEKGIFDAGGGVPERLIKAAGEASISSAFFKMAATKKYTYSRLRRAALYTFLGVTEADVRSTPQFTVLLAANKRGREFIASTKKSRGIGILTKPSDMSALPAEAGRQYELWSLADELYSLVLKNGVKKGEFLRRGPRIF